MKGNPLPAGLVSNLQDVLNKRKGNEGGEGDQPTETTSTSTSAAVVEEIDSSKPVILLTNGDGIDSPGLVYLVEALVREGLYNINVCAPESDKSVSGHSVTHQETISVSSVEIKGTTAYEVSGTPVDCVSLSLSGALFSWSKPLLVISGINRGSSCGNQMLYSGVVAGAKEALISGIPSLSISLNWKKDESQESDFKEAVSVCLPLINSAIRDIEKGAFPRACSLDIEIPTSPSKNKGFKLTKPSMVRSTPSWLAVSANRNPAAGHFMSNQQSLGLQLAQLGRDASAAGAARRLNTQKENVEIESVGVSRKSENNRVKKYFRLEFVVKEQEDMDADFDVKSLEEGFVTITPLSVVPLIESDIQAAASDWIATALQ